MKKFKSPGHLQRFLSTHDHITNLFRLLRYEMRATDFREMRSLACKSGAKPLSLKWRSDETAG